MPSSQFDTLCPVVRSERLRLVRLIDVEGLERSRVPVRFECDVDYVRHSETTAVVLGPNGKVLKTATTHSDWYGFLTSPEEILGVAEDLATEYGAYDGPLVVEARVTVTEEALVPLPKDGGYPGRRHYLHPHNGWMVDDEKTVAFLAAPPLSEAKPTTIRPASYETLLWSSVDAREPGAAGRRLAAFLGTALAGLPEGAADRVRASKWVAALRDGEAVHA